ncbi:polar amino acid transport system permease protein [Pseudochelatococcus lubricantis]|uniref:Polar amino acid transport system permease protein n=1 Tax=Pseudochelatococcus lubricantis TaxID=1538102 RepID=A0ABX0V1S8_9HYPH|nr:amino acid ABC transporter permease [Pseudochelatococcus lubricantis]NIJ58265.1 polar amino acid transport system permease protein [Pseudochelatococcus lubricantis]
MLETNLGWNDILFMLKGAGVTLSITAWAMLGGTILGMAFGLARTTLPWWLNAPLGAVLDVLRSVPLLIQFVLANSFKSIIGVNASAFTVACVMLSLYTASYCSEIVRGGILAVPATTRRAARSLGMTYRQDLAHIVFPMALRVALPNWIGLVLSVMKDTALVLWIGIVELLRASQIVVTRLQEPLLVLSVAGLIYFLMSFPVARLGARLEKRWHEND